MEDYKEKYEMALEGIQEILSSGQDSIKMPQLQLRLQGIFPELRGDEDEKIRKALVRFHKSTIDIDGIKGADILAWLEKQGNIDKTSYDIAEKEKYDFVSGRFIKCRKSFDEFKEDTSYWLEYVGNDNYIGRSDNILNQKFHITPRQLYCLFTQEHCPKEDNANAPTEYGKYVDECLNDASEHFFSEGEDKYSVADLFYAGVRCGKSWFEKQGTSTKLSEEEQNSFSKGVLSNCALSFINYLDTHSYEGKMCVSNGECEDIENAFHNAMWDRLHRYYCKYIEKQGEQKPILDFKASNWYVSKVDGKIHDMTYNPTNKIEPKFKVGDWIIHQGTNNIYQVVAVIDNQYHLKYGDNYTIQNCADVDRCARLWDITKDAKKGDVLRHNGCTFIFICIEKGVVKGLEENLYNGTKACNLGEPNKNNDYSPATKEQRDILMKAMADAGYTFNFEKKELKKIEDEIEIPFGAKDSELQEATYYIPKGFHAEEDDDKVVIKKGEKSAAWSDKDENFMYDTLSNLTELKDRYGEVYGNVGKCIDWLKSLKDRITWKPNKEQIEALDDALNERGFDYNYLNSLYEQLKKL